MSQNPFDPSVTADPFGGLPQGLIPNPPPEIPAAPAPGDATATMSPFNEPLDVEQIAKNLVLDRPLKFYIPNRERYKEWEFRIINSKPQEIADAHNKGFREVTDDALCGLFKDLVAGTDKEGHAYRPILMARPVAIGKIVEKKKLQQLSSIYAGLDPTKKQFQGRYVEGITQGKDASKGDFSGDGWRIRVPD